MSATQHFSFDLPVWRVLYDATPTSATHNLLALELRTKTSVEWCVMEVETAQILWQHTFAETDWWTSLIGFFAGKLLLHSYTSNEQPAPKKLLVVDAFSGEINWSLEGCKFEQTDGHTLQTTRLSSEQSLMEEHWLLTDGTKIRGGFLKATQEYITWKSPVVHQETSLYYSVIGQFIHKITRQMPQKAINYGEIAEHVLFFQYLYPANAITLSQSILVINSAKSVLLHETIESSVNDAVFGGCFYSEHHIIFLKKLDELVIFKLPKR